MRTKFSLGIGFTEDAVVTDVAKDIPFVSTPNELRALIKTGGFEVKKAEAAHSGGIQAAGKTTGKTAGRTRVAAQTKRTKQVKSAKQTELQGITNLTEGGKGASDGFKRTVHRELNANFYTPDDGNGKSESAAASLARAYRLRAEEQSLFKKSAFLLLNDMAGTAARSNPDNAALLQARADFYASGVRVPCADYVFLFDKEDAVSVQEQKDICRTCPLVDKCLKMALLGDESFGVWGGLDPKERAALRRKAMRERRNKALGGIQ